MSTIDKKQISEALRAAMNRENLHTSQVARFLNLNPVYVSMALNPNAWDHIGKTAWIRLEDWMLSMAPIKEFIIPEGEEIFVRKPYVPKPKSTKSELASYPKKIKPKEQLTKKEKSTIVKAMKDLDESIKKATPNLSKIKDVDKTLEEIRGNEELMHSPDLQRKEKVKEVTEIVTFSKAEIEALDKKFSPLFELIQKATDAAKKITDIYYTDQVTISQKFNEIDKKLKEEKKAKKREPHIVIFQRNIYHK
jgi:hypothetical protein